MKKPIWLIVLGVILFVIAVIVPVITVLPLMMKQSAETITFLVPGETELAVKENGRYYLWNDYKTVFNGRSFTRLKTLPDGLDIQLIDLASGSKINLTSDSSLTSTRGSNEKVSVGYFALPPGKYRLNVSGEFPARVFSIGESKLGTILIVALVTGFLSIITALVSIGMIIFGIVKLVKKKA